MLRNWADRPIRAPGKLLMNLFGAIMAASGVYGSSRHSVSGVTGFHLSPNVSSYFPGRGCRRFDAGPSSVTVHSSLASCPSLRPLIRTQRHGVALRYKSVRTRLHHMHGGGHVRNTK
ncbi:hypothetical protein GDO78_009034 [Eleutherodactylus coqui]|uniref:Uncharacterized protein n=1 Tax=Eleutherodactylus coqui TaxID=57060 RepID=A0A8J6F9Q2_ELECQ|nr:hypothetical protein GDO78_009034 [Eleutherodactylus coqui]